MQHKSELDKCISNKLKQESFNNIIPRTKIIIILGRFYHIPKESRNNIIKELESKGLIKIISKFEVEVI